MAGAAARTPESQTPGSLIAERVEIDIEPAKIRFTSQLMAAQLQSARVTPLDRRWRLPGSVVGDSRDAAHFVHDATRDEADEFKGHLRRARRHEIDGLRRALRYRIKKLGIE